MVESARGKTIGGHFGPAPPSNPYPPEQMTGAVTVVSPGGKTLATIPVLGAASAALTLRGPGAFPQPAAMDTVTSWLGHPRRPAVRPACRRVRALRV